MTGKTFRDFMHAFQARTCVAKSRAIDMNQRMFWLLNQIFVDQGFLQCICCS